MACRSLKDKAHELPRKADNDTVRKAVRTLSSNGERLSLPKTLYLEA
jgi:hypothetical protein